MPPRPSSSSSAISRNATTPYSRRPASQPKSSRQQFSACGACRMRRVRCDLKDLPIASIGPIPPTCSNCKERGIKCVDEFADVKAVKLLRRGRRLQQVEAIYGKMADQESDGSSSAFPLSNRSTKIPTLQVDFFVSPFWRWLMIQRPILDPAGFSARFLAHSKGTHPLGPEGGLIAMLLVVWATSFGLNESGLPENNGDEPDLNPTSLDPSNGNQDEKMTPAGAKNLSAHPERRWKDRAEAMLREVLELIDFHGILRRPTLDGVRVLLLLLPLMEDAQPLERLAIYEAALSQVQALCTLSPPLSSSQVIPRAFDEAAVRARIFWYAYTQEGLLTGMRGGRFVLENEDLECFQRTLPSLNSGLHTPDSPSSGDPMSIMSTYHLSSQHDTFQDLSHPSSRSYIRLINASSMPLHLSNICRRIHMVLTGIKAARRAEEHGLIDAHGMYEIWRDLDHSWHEFEEVRRSSQFNDYDSIHKDQYVSGWQIFIFECHNVIRESLKQYMSTIPAQDMDSHSRPSSHSSNSSPYLSPHYLHATATRKCMSLLPSVVRTIRRHTSRELKHGEYGLFTWDAGLVRDGCFFAAYLSVTHQGELLDIDGRDYREEMDDTAPNMTSEEAVSICLTALSRMRWAFSKSEEREETVRMIWENQQDGKRGQSLSHRNSDFDHHGYPHRAATSDSQHIDLPPRPQTMSTLSTYNDRPTLPSLSHFAAQRRVESAPSTACSVDGRGANGWPLYTPPGTTTSIATSTGTGLSARDSPDFPSLGTYKLQPDDAFYNGDMDQFSFHAPLTGPMVREPAGLTNVANFTHHGPPDAQHLGITQPSGFINSSVFPQASIHPDFNSCPQFGDDCNEPYH